MIWGYLRTPSANVCEIAWLSHQFPPKHGGSGTWIQLRADFLGTPVTFKNAVSSVPQTEALVRAWYTLLEAQSVAKVLLSGSEQEEGGIPQSQP